MGSKKAISHLEPRGAAGRRLVSVLFAGLIGLTFSCGANPGDSVAPLYAKFDLKRWAYLYHALPLKGDYRRRLENVLGSYDIVSLTGYKLERRGNLKKSDNRKIYSFLQSRNILLLPLISFQSAGQGRALLRSSEARKRARKSLLALLKQGELNQKNYAGVHLDFEYLSPADNKYYALFLREFKADFIKLNRLRLNGALRTNRPFLLTAAIFPQVDFPSKLAGFHNLATLAPFLDEITLMCYDYHRPGGPAGPVTDVAWCKKNIQAVTKFIAPRKIWLGVPAYGYAWSPGVRTRVLSEVKDLPRARRQGAKRDSGGVLTFRFKRAGKTYQATLADSETRNRLRRLAREHKLRGTALWRLGFENPRR